MSTKRVLILLGSPRKKGNSTLLAAEVAAGARESGAEVESVYLHGLDLRPCAACDACREGRAPDCAIPDDMRALYPKVRAADVLVLASPVYWFTVSAQTKLFLDRCYALMGSGGDAPSGLAGKRVGLVLTYGDVDVFRSGGVNALRTVQDICRYVEADFAGAVYGTAEAAGEIARRTDLREEARALGRSLGASPPA